MSWCDLDRVNPRSAMEDLIDRKRNGSPGRELSISRRVALFLLLLLLSGCSGQKVISKSLTPSMVMGINHTTWTLSPSRTPTPTGTKVPPSPSLTRSPTTVPYNFSPTPLPTPTRGLPPTATLSPKETCPPPMHAQVNIQFSDNPLDYGPQILQYISAIGGVSGIKEQIEKFGRTWSNGYFADQAYSTEDDVTGDTVKDYVIVVNQYLDQKDYGKDYEPAGYTAIFVIGCQSDEYVGLYQNALRSLGWGIDYQLNPKQDNPITIKDFNLDGIQEILYSMLYEFDHMFSVRSDLLEWNGSSFHSLAVDQRRLLISDTVPGFQDVDNNGTIELLLREDPLGYRHECDEGPWRYSYDIYMWDGAYYRYMWTDPGIPVYRFQAAFDGDYYAAVGLFDKSEALYKKSIKDPALKSYSYQVWVAEAMGAYCSLGIETEPNEPQWITEYARFRLLELHVAMNDIGAAWYDWKFIFGVYSFDSPYASLAGSFWQNYLSSGNITDACLAIKQVATLNKKDIFDRFSSYGFFNPGPTVDNICPFTTPTAE